MQRKILLFFVPKMQTRRLYTWYFLPSITGTANKYQMNQGNTDSICVKWKQFPAMKLKTALWPRGGGGEYLVSQTDLI